MGWLGEVFDCDFNQMLNMPWRDNGTALHLWDVDPARVEVLAEGADVALLPMADEIGVSTKRSAILFGPERSGLETEEVALANAIVTVPINPDFASLNLAQAVILLAYEWSKRASLAQPTAKETEPPAAHGELEGLIGHLNRELEAKGYFHPPSRTQATKNTLRTILTKTGWSSREIKAIRGVFRALSGSRSSKT